jgi:GNAT superfamily N-acetyltransferase
MAEFARTDIKTLAPRIAPLLQAAWTEANSALPYGLSPNMDMYCEMEERNILRLFVARVEGVLVGYAIAFIAPRPHNTERLVGVVDVIYVDLDHRRRGVAHGLLTFAENALRAEGIHTLSLGARDERFARWLRISGGYKYAETIYEKEL